MSFSKDKFIEGFIAETGEHLDLIANSVIELKASSQNKEMISLILRELHTVKGTARMMGYTTIEKLSHGLEDVFKGLREEKYGLNDNIAQLSFITCDCIRSVLDKIRREGSDAMPISKYLDAFEKASSGLFFSTDVFENDFKKDIDTDLQEGGSETESLENITSIRIDLSRINEIVRSFDNLIIRQFRFKHQLEEFESRLLSKEDACVHELPKQLKEELLLTETAIFDTQHLLLNLRMLPLDMVLTPLKREITSDTIKLKKQIDFDVPSTDFMLDKIILEKLRNILMHLVRNSIDHGIESPAERKKKNKSEKGHISISAQQLNNHIVICVKDDGRGIQYDKVRAKAQEFHPKMAKKIQEMEESELQQFLFEPGFSTAKKTSELSGRGVGLDAVRTDMEKIKGRIKLVTKKNEGTSFELTIPLTLATQQGLFVHSGGMKFMIPSHYIQEIVDVNPETFTVMQSQTFVSLHRNLIPVYYLSSIIGTGHQEKSTSLIVVEYLDTRIAIVVDSIDQYENVVVNPLPPVMQKMEGLQGVVYDENYAIIPILNIPDIMRRMKALLSYDIKKYQSKNRKHIRTVLIVDDSVTTRQIEQTIFETDGYKVETAVDGIEALDILRAKKIDAIITDIKMPRMDGMVFLSNIRRLEDYGQTPVIVVSGVYDPEARSKFLDAGAQAFIVKSEFQRGNLLQAVKELLGEY